MKISQPTQLSRQDFPDAPNWITNLLYPIQLFFNNITNALQNNLTLQDNISCVINQITMTAGATDANNTAQFRYTLGRVPVEMSCYATRTDGVYDIIYPQVSWNLVNANIVINGIKGLTPSVQYNLTFVVR